MKWKLVPVEPTPEMIDAWNNDDSDEFRHAYHVMLEAAPQPPVPSVPDGWRQFLTDVITAAGLLKYGKRDKGLADRIGSFAFDAMRAAAPQPQRLSDERIREIWVDHGLDDEYVEEFARAVEREILGGGDD